MIFLPNNHIVVYCCALCKQGYCIIIALMFKKILRENKPRNLKKDIRNMNFFFLLSPLTDPGGFFVFFLVTNQHLVKIVWHI